MTYCFSNWEPISLFFAYTMKKYLAPYWKPWALCYDSGYILQIYHFEEFLIMFNWLFHKLATQLGYCHDSIQRKSCSCLLSPTYWPRCARLDWMWIRIIAWKTIPAHAWKAVMRRKALIRRQTFLRHCTGWQQKSFSVKTCNLYFVSGTCVVGAKKGRDKFHLT